VNGVATAAAAAAPGTRHVPEIRFGPDGLIPAIIQDVSDGRVLMLAWMDAEAVATTIETGEIHFHSRSRDRLWRKGETSGNVLRLVDLAVDCDGDTVLVTAEPAGPTCHRGTRSCFDPAGASSVATTQGFAWLETLWSTIVSRAADRPAGSYTASMLEGGVDAAGRKVTEEATELLLAAKDDATASSPATRGALAREAADLLYHVLVLLAGRDLPPSRVIDTLRARHAPKEGLGPRPDSVPDFEP
jgi:phosphoribosyl-ATP pyrophosphohydrolase/phosphoribosyl-AMP cyclohydrolase